MGLKNRRFGVSGGARDKNDAAAGCPRCSGVAWRGAESVPERSEGPPEAEDGAERQATPDKFICWTLL
jgi:hypothetical protein